MSYNRTTYSQTNTSENLACSFFSSEEKSCTGAYRFGFNGQVKDDEIYGEGNTYSAQYWEYDARLGRRWNIDPVDQISISNYACFGDNPVVNIDPMGDSTLYYSSDGSFFVCKT
jgi:RHS repeat-associated protein